MRIVEARHNEVPAQINDLRLRPFQFHDVHIFSDRLNAVAAHRDGFLAQGGTERRIRRHARINIRVEVEIGIGPGLAASVRCWELVVLSATLQRCQEMKR